MSLLVSSQVLPFVVSAAVLFVILVFALHNWREPAAPWLSAAFAALLLWCIAYILELTSFSVAGKVFWADVQFVGATSLPIFWLLTIRTMVGRPSMRRGVLAVLWLLCAAILVLMVLNPAGLYRGHPTVRADGPIRLLDADYGLAYYLGWVVFTFGLFAWSLALVARAAAHSRRPYRRRNLFLAIATLLPMVGGALYIANVLPWHYYNPAMAEMSASAVLCGYALWRYRLFDVAPLARDAVIEHLADGVVVLDDEDRVVDFNKAAARILPELTRARLGDPAGDLLAGWPALLQALERLDQGEAGAPGATLALDKPLVVELPGEDDDPLAGARHYSMALTTVAGRGGRRLGVAIVLHDVTRRVAQLDRMHRLASTDSLTGLLSRRRFFELAEQEVARARRHSLPVSFLLLDLDGFKLVNDVHGHAAGDAVLREAAVACRRELRSFDLIGRFGGDELCVMMPHEEPAEAERAAERLRRAVAGIAVRHDGCVITTTLSVGVSGVRHVRGETVEALFEAADQALYLAKHEGRDMVRAADMSAARTPRPALEA